MLHFHGFMPASGERFRLFLPIQNDPDGGNSIFADISKGRIST